MKKLAILAACVALSGCAGLVDYASEALNEMRDTSRYEVARGLEKTICSTDNRDALILRYGKDVVDRWTSEVCNE